MARLELARSGIKLSADAPFLAFGLPVRKTSPVDFWIHFFQAFPPLNVKTAYIWQKAAEQNVIDGQLPAAARNSILKEAIANKIDYVLFLDDDVLFPDISFYRLWNQMRGRPDVACITAIGSTKLQPAEPLIYKDIGSGAYYDWRLGDLFPIHSAWAGCMIVNMEYVRRIPEPWFNDVMHDAKQPEEGVKRNIMGQDRFFHMQLQDAGGLVMADGGLHVGHFDVDLQKPYILPHTIPCFQNPPTPNTESFIPGYINEHEIGWTRVFAPLTPDPKWKGYLDWLATNNTQDKQISVIPMDDKHNIGINYKFDPNPPQMPVPESAAPFAEWMNEVRKVERRIPREGYTLVDKRKDAYDSEPEVSS